MTALGLTLIVAIIAIVSAQLWLCGREINFQSARRRQLRQRPTESREPCRQKTEIDYTIANVRVTACAAVGNGLILFVMSLGGGLSFVHTTWISAVSPSFLAEILTVVTIVVIGASFLRLLDACKQFIIDRRFGFGKTSALLFAMDTSINGVLLVAVASLLTAASIAAMAKFGVERWFAVWLIWICFDWGRSWLYSGTLAHMFDRLETLSDEVLTTRIGELMRRSGCVIDKIEVVDSSKRSTHANAYVAGIGKTKRVIFNDTLLAILTKAEIIAVMAHELGHIRNLHVIKDLSLRATVAFIWIVGMGYFLEAQTVQVALNAPMASDGMLLALLWLLTPIFAFVAKPLISSMRRSYEFEADRFVLCHSDSGALQSALKKLHKRNASASVSDPLYGFVHRSHPSLRDRIGRLCDEGR